MCCTQLHLQPFEVPVSNKTSRFAFSPGKKKKKRKQKRSIGDFGCQSPPTITNVNRSEDPQCWQKTLCSTMHPWRSIPGICCTEEGPKAHRGGSKCPLKEHITPLCSHSFLGCPSPTAKRRPSLPALFCAHPQRQEENSAQFTQQLQDRKGRTHPATAEKRMLSLEKLNN